MKNQLYPVHPRRMQTKSRMDCFIAILFAGIFTLALSGSAIACIAWFFRSLHK